MLKLVITTHPEYKPWLRNFLDSLFYKEHLDDIIISVGDVPSHESEHIIQEYKNEFGLLHVFTYDKNLHDYTGFVSIGQEILENKLNVEDMYLMLHDSMEAGPRFWKQFEELRLITEIKNSVSVKSLNDKFIIDEFPAKYEYLTRVLGSGFRFQNILKTITTNTYAYNDTHNVLIADIDRSLPLFLGKRMTLVHDIKQAIKFPSKNDIEEIIALETELQWFPLVDSFNIGIASGTFLAYKVYPNMKDATFDIYTSYEIQNNINHLYNLKNLAQQWKYIYPETKTFFSNYQNDTDILNTGERRSVAYLHPFDLKKFFECINNTNIK